MTNPGTIRNPRRVQPTPEDVAAVWNQLSKERQDDIDARAFAADQMTFEYVIERFGVVAGVLFGPRRSGIGGRTQGEPSWLKSS